MKIVGYADRLSVQPGQSIRFMVSSELPAYRTEIVRLIHGYDNNFSRITENVLGRFASDLPLPRD